MHLSLKNFRSSCLAIGLAVTACNVYNPSGEGDVGTTSDAQMSEGESLFRKMDYPGSAAAYAKVIAQDSGNSLAYYGYSKAIMRYWQVNASGLLTEVSKAQGGGIPFIGSDDWTITRYLQATSKVRKALSLMTERDTLTRWYNYTLDPNTRAAKKDRHLQARIAFMQGYWDRAERGFPNHWKKSQFPLSDLRLGYDKIIADFGFVELIYAVTHLRDLNGDDSINSDDDLLKKLNFSMDGGFKVENLEDIQTELEDPENRAQFNNLIQNVASGLGSAGQVIDLLGPMLEAQGGGAGDSLDKESLTQSVTENMDSVVTSIGDAVTFYQFGDMRDNDGDGCVDEEILDGKDNDDDGFTDEDARITPIDLVDNDKNGKQGFEDADEGLNSSDKLRFSEAAGFIKGPEYKNKNIKIWVQQDSLDTKASLSVSQKVVLDSAQRAIGGCWNNYK